MPTVHCPHCDAVLRYGEDLAGRRVRCGTCTTPFTVPEYEPREDFEEERPRHPRRRRSSAGGPDYSIFIKIGIGVAVVGLLVVVGLLLVPLARALTRPPAPAVADSDWQKFEVPGRFRGLMPGTTNTKTVPGPAVMVMHECSPSKDLFCVVGYSRDPLRPERLAVGNDQILTDACDGALRNAREMGGREVSRSIITLNGRFPGRELVINVPQLRGKMVFRLYLVNGIIFMVGAGGRGVEPGGPVPEKLFSSFETL